MKSLLRYFAALSTLSIVALAAVPSTAPQAPTFTSIYGFAGGADSAFPSSALILDAEGNLYGETQGPPGSHGTVYELSPTSGTGWTLNTLYSFQGSSDGSYPVGGLVFDTKGNLYGVTSEGGHFQDSHCLPEGCGTVFELSPNGSGGWQKTTLHEFLGGDDGDLPLGALIFDASGNLYGTTSGGGHGGSCDNSNGCGTVFELHSTNGAWTESVLHSFGNGTDGKFLEAALVFDTQGNLYGSTNAGGPSNGTCYYGCGAIFELSPQPGGRWSEQSLHVFTGGNDGAYPYSTPVFDAAGNLYATASQGGLYNEGVVFELMPSSDGNWTEQVLHNFQGLDGEQPGVGVIFDRSGTAYGTTAGGGNAGYGAAYRLTPSGGGKFSFSPLVSFVYDDGRYPYQLVLNGEGMLFGTANQGGVHDLGNVFSITP